MKFQISTQEFNYLINKVLNVGTSKTVTLPILSNFLLEAYNDELILTATDMSVGIRCFTDAKITEEGSTTLPAKKLSQLLKELTVPQIELTTTQQEITTLKAGTSRFKLHGMSRETFPALPSLENHHSFQISQSQLRHLISSCSFAVSKDDSRYVLTGILMKISNGQLSFVATDGKRLARTQTTIEINPEFNSQSIIPYKAIDEILSLLTEEETAKVSIMPDKIAIEANNTLIVAKLLSGEYPDISRFVPTNCNIIMNLHREELIVLLRQIALFNPTPTTPVRIVLENGEMILSAQTAEIGEGHVSMPVNYYGPKLELAFNANYLIDVLRHCQKETVTLGLTDEYNPAILAEEGDIANPMELNPLFVIMPMRLENS